MRLSKQKAHTVAALIGVACAVVAVLLPEGRPSPQMLGVLWLGIGGCVAFGMAGLYARKG